MYDSVADYLDNSGLGNETFSGDDLNAMPDGMDAEPSKIDTNAIEYIISNALHGDAMGATISQGDATDSEANTSSAYAFEADDLEAEAEAIETMSQGKVHVTLPNIAC